MGYKLLEKKIFKKRLVREIAYYLKHQKLDTKFGYSLVESIRMIPFELLGYEFSSKLQINDFRS